MKRAVSKPNFILGSLIIVILASVVVFASAITTDNQTTITTSLNDTLAGPSNVTAPNNTVVLQNGNITTQIQQLTTPDNTPAGYLINGQVNINTSGYNCSIHNDGKIYLVCDSIYDGNGDGICTSGESCIQLGIVGNYVTRKERNSQDQWTEHDQSFTLSRPAVPQ